MIWYTEVLKSFENIKWKQLSIYCSFVLPFFWYFLNYEKLNIFGAPYSRSTIQRVENKGRTLLVREGNSSNFHDRESQKKNVIRLMKAT